MFKCLSRMTSLSVALAMIGACAVSVRSVSADTVTWIAGPSPTTSVGDISLEGTLVHAGYWRDSGGDITVTAGSETIAFARRPVGASDGYAGISAEGTTDTIGGWYGPILADANFSRVLNGFAYNGAGDITIQGLTPGRKYQIELFATDDRNAALSARTELFSDSAIPDAGNDTAAFTFGSNSHVLGTFTASAASTHLYVRGVSSADTVVDAYVLRDVTPTPEPGTIILVATVLVGLMAYAWRRRKCVPS